MEKSILKISFTFIILIFTIALEAGKLINCNKTKSASILSEVTEEDQNFGESGKYRVKTSRKYKVREAGHDDRKPVIHHLIYLELPSPMQQGKMYRIEIDENLKSGETLKIFNYDTYSAESRAIKISNIGYEAGAKHISADVYLWMGEGGERDFSRFTGKPWHLYNVSTEEIVHSGKLTFRMENKKEPWLGKGFNGADVRECNFSEFDTSGEYRLVIGGIGSSYSFDMDGNRFDEAFKVAMQGMFYQRRGCEDKPIGNFPKARRPLFKKGVEPERFRVFISKKNMVKGKNPDNCNFYSEDLTGEIAEATWGGWCDVYDNDQRPVNFICVFDILLTYYLNPQAFSDNQLYVPESGNGIPNIIDEALWEIDWWLRMRDSKGGYLNRLTNIRLPENVYYAGAPCAWQGWCVAASAAMAADCFHLSGNKQLQQKYTEEATTAWKWAQIKNDQMLDTDVSVLRGKDLKMNALAFLYNLTGKPKYEKAMHLESEIKEALSKMRNPGKWEQRFAAIAYFFTPKKVNYPELQGNMKKAIINQAKNDYLVTLNDSPTKAARCTSTWEGMAQTFNEMSLVVIAHKLSDNQKDKIYFEKGMYAVTEWASGSNALGMVQMTGLGDRCLTQTFAPGRRDGYPHVTPGGHLTCAVMDGVTRMIFTDVSFAQTVIIPMTKKSGHWVNISGTADTPYQIMKLSLSIRSGRELCYMGICKA